MHNSFLENVFGKCARAVMQPFLEARFTPGIADGGERGSSKGLGPLLDELLAYVQEVRFVRGQSNLIIVRATMPRTAGISNM